LFLTIAVAATLVVLVFARDVARSAHSAIGPRRSENLSFAGLSNALIAQENSFDTGLVRLLRTGPTLSRPVFYARLSLLHEELPVWANEAELLRRPKLDHDINDVMAQITESRIDAYESIMTSITRDLTLPGFATLDNQQPTAAPARALLASVTTWDRDRFVLSKEPGLVTLHKLTSKAATYYANSGDQALVASTTLALSRGVGVAAVLVTPAPLPAPKGEILLPPVDRIHVGVSIKNASFVDQAVTINVVMIPSNGPIPGERQSLHVNLGPLQAFAYTPKDFSTVASERATLQVTVTGAPAAPGMVTTRSYRVELSPSGHA
jgi:hypothetical protein